MRPSKEEQRIANAIPYVRIARRRVRDYHRRGAFVTPEELFRVEKLLTFAVEILGGAELEDGEVESTMEGEDG